MASVTYRAAESETAAVRTIRETGKGQQHELPEKLLWKLWKRRAARRDEFRTSAGTRVRVLYPGRAGVSAGPDFRDALLDVEGMGLVRGDVEIHRRQRDWDAHGHSDDPNYNGVVIHAAVDTDEPETALASGAAAIVLPMGDLLESNDHEVEVENSASEALWEALERKGYQRPGTSEAIAATLDRAGDERFRRKASLLARFTAEQGPEQTLYEALMEGLGYRHNQGPFVRLAQNATFQAVRAAALPVLAQQRPMVIQHWLLTLAGLGDTPASPLPIGFGPALDRREWRLFRVRPGNHPAVRIQGAAVLISRSLDQGFVSTLMEDCESPKGLTAALTVEFGGGGVSPIGKGRARDLAVNVVLPLFHGLGGDSDSPYLELYRRFPSLQRNDLEREMAEQLLGKSARPLAKGARRQQGLLHLAALLRGGG